jgi:hypothetical protein
MSHDVNFETFIAFLPDPGAMNAMYAGSTSKWVPIYHVDWSYKCCATIDADDEIAKYKFVPAPSVTVGAWSEFSGQSLPEWKVTAQLIIDKDGENLDNALQCVEPE